MRLFRATGVEADLELRVCGRSFCPIPSNTGRHTSAMHYERTKFLLGDDSHSDPVLCL